MNDSLKIENLSRIVDSIGNDVASESFVSAEMKKTGMQNPGLGHELENGNDTTKTFANILMDSVEKVNVYQSQADRAVKELLAGRSKNIHETMLAVERADVSLKLMMQVRNKVLDAYREIIRMQV